MQKGRIKCSTANRGSIQDLNGNDLAKIILWNNKFICIRGKSVYFKSVAEKGIIKTGDLIFNNNELIANEPSRAKTRGWRGGSIIEPCVLRKKSRVLVR